MVLQKLYLSKERLSKLYRKHIPKPVRFALDVILAPFKIAIIFIFGVPLFLITGLICGIMHAWEDYE